MKTRSIVNLIFVYLLVSMVACKSNDNNPSKIPSDVINVPATASGKQAALGTPPVMTFNEEKHDFGKIKQGEKVSYSFVFKNTGGSDLVISSAQGSCGCTIPTYPKEAIKPGQESKIDVVFDSDGKTGTVQKTVTLVTNCSPSTKVLTISSNIEAPEDEE
ncbi:MAG: DUF1573 domain-containing protein [Bacteroidia bacterium]